MLLGYDKTGAVIWTSGTNSAFPLGPPDDLVPILSGHGDLQLLRLHDVEDAEQVQAVLTHEVTVSGGRLVVGEPLPEEAPPPPVEPVTREEFDMLMTMVLEG